MKWKPTMKRWLAAALSCAILAAEPGFLAAAASDDTLPERPAASAANIAPGEPDVEPYVITTQPYAAVIEAAETTAAEWEHPASTTATADAVQSIAAATTGASEATVQEMTRKRYDSPSLSSDAAAAAMATYPTDPTTERATTQTTTTAVYNVVVAAGSTEVEAGVTVELPIVIKGINHAQSGTLQLKLSKDAGPTLKKFSPSDCTTLDAVGDSEYHFSVDLSKVPSTDPFTCIVITFLIPPEAAPGTIYNFPLSGNCKTESGWIKVGAKAPFDPLIDGNSFRHSSKTGGGFYGVVNKRFHDEKYINALCTLYGYGMESKINKLCDEEWHGSCRGIAETIALQYNNRINVENLSQDDAQYYYMMENPCNNNEFIDTINYYQIKQNLDASGTLITYNRESFMNNWLSDTLHGKTLPNTLKYICNKLQSNTNSEIYVFSYGYTYVKKESDGGGFDKTGHAIVALDCSFNKAENCYEVFMFDENHRNETITMQVSADYKKFGFIDGNGNHIGNLDTSYNFNYIGLVSPRISNLPNAANPNYYDTTVYSKKSYNSDALSANTSKLELEFPMDAEFLLTNKAGEYLRYQGENTDATMSLSNCRIIQNTDNCVVSLETDYSDSFTLINLEDKVSLMVSGSYTLLSLDNAEVSSAVFDLSTNNIHITKANGDFTVYLPPKENDGAVVRFSGTAKGTVDVSASAGEIQLSGDSITDATAKAITSEQTQRYYMHDGNKVTATFSNEGELISDMLSPFGDVNCDHEVNVVDVVSLQKWLLNAPNAKLPNWVVADLCEDGEIDAYDLALLKQRLITETAQSDWVLASKVPAGAKITATKYTYDLTKLEETTSSSPTMAGWTLSSSAWKKSSSGTYAYANYPSGFDTGYAYYKKYEKSALKASESTSAKREVSAAKLKSYIYWHWNYLLGTPGPLDNRYVNDHECGEYVPDGKYYTFCHFSAFESTTNLTESDSSGEVFKFNTGNYDDVSWWWYKLPVYEQTYTDYKKEYRFTRTTVEKSGLESKTDPTGQPDVSNVQKWVKYLKK